MTSNESNGESDFWERMSNLGRRGRQQGRAAGAGSQTSLLLWGVSAV